MADTGKLPGLFVPENTRRTIEAKARRSKAWDDGKRIDSVAIEWRFRGERSWRTVMVVPDGSPGNTQTEVANAARQIVSALAGEYVKVA